VEVCRVTGLAGDGTLADVVAILNGEREER